MAHVESDIPFDPLLEAMAQHADECIEWADIMRDLAINNNLCVYYSRPAPFGSLQLSNASLDAFEKHMGLHDDGTEQWNRTCKH